MEKVALLGILIAVIGLLAEWSTARAREAGVAVSTASRALSNPDRVSERTREHVREVAERLGYRPNRIAQAWASGRTRMLAIVVPDITNPHHFGLIRGAAAAAKASKSRRIGDGCRCCLSGRSTPRRRGTAS